MKWIGLLICPFFVLTQNSVNCQTFIPKAYQKALDLQFQESRNLIQEGIDSQIPHLDLYIANFNDILELFFSEDEARYEELSKNEKVRIKVLDNSSIDSPYIRFLRAEIKLQWAFTKLKFGDQWSAAWSLRNAYRTIKRNIKRYPDFALNQKSLGLLHIIFGAIPSRYQWILGLFGLEGNVISGLEELATISNVNSVFALEARLTMALVNAYLLERPTDALNFVDGSGDHSDTENYIRALLLMKNHQSDSARVILQNQKSEVPIFSYLIGETYFQQGAYLEAKAYYERFLEQFRGNNNVKDAYFKVGLCFLFLNEKDQFEDFRQKALSSGKSWSEVDKNASDLLESIATENKSLIQLRYAIDGGFLQRSDSLISVLEMIRLPHYDKIEFDYRKARKSHLERKIQQAISGYEEIIKSDNQIPENYFAPNSLLQLGYIYLEQSDSAKAKMYLERVLEFRKHPYKNSLDSKAKIALSQINN